MPTMLYSWADQCTNSHDPDRSVLNGQVGQNLYITYGSAYQPSPNLADGVQGWFNEVSLYVATYICDT